MAIKTIRRLQVGQVDTTSIEMVAAWERDTFKEGLLLHLKGA
jgi:hypothetical protein